MAQDYGQIYYTYPILSAQGSFEGAQKRFKSMPTPADVYARALSGLPKIFPMTNELITPEYATEFLESAMSDIEMETSLNLTPVDEFQPFDFIDGLVTANYTGLKLSRYPATKVIAISWKLPHAVTATPYTTYSVPPSWVSLVRNNVNIVASYGSVAVMNDNSNVNLYGGLFGIGNIGNGAWRPAAIEVQYTAGFPNDQLPVTVWEMIVVLAAKQMLENILAPLFPTNSVSVSIDAVAQSASIPIAQLLGAKIDYLQAQYDKKKANIKTLLGMNLKTAYLGA